MTVLLGAAPSIIGPSEVGAWMAAKGAPGAAALLDFAGQKYGFRSAAGVPRWGSVAADMAFSRASAAGRWRADGVYEMVGSNALRYDHDPVTREPLGVRIEGAATNLLTYSECPAGTADLISGSNITAVSDIEGGRTGLRLNNTTANAWAYKANPLATGTQATLSVLVEMEDGAPPVFGGGAVSGLNTFALVAGGPTLVPTVIARVGTKVWRCGWSGTSGGTGGVGVFQATTNQQRRIKVTGFQLEAGSRASSYIVTGATTGVRGTDNLSMPLPIVPANGFTIAFGAHMPRYGNVGDANVLLNLMPAASTANRIGIDNFGRSNEVWMAFPGGVGTYRLATGIAPGAEFYGALSWSAAQGWRGTALGGTVINVTTQPAPAADLARITIGSRAGAAPWNDTIERLAMWSHGDFTDVQLQGLLE
ncbi:phage head spike fiber domain-containing protein [Ancylobacter polymorphus]|uniref:Minor tail protein n=1 Tax=Ancylobacter polymorphus TaxID=223390 RepID=A0ABU0B6A9_9HYPH|nr:hypothetical protein [Ancylobacter polymorphus]MDQ0301353.1 hypothetical protein [Ancylobacter polymorphus]